MEAERRTASFDTPLELDGGGVLERFDIAYETYGELDADGGNAILVCHGLTAGAAAGGEAHGERRRGWWADAIGPGKPLDTNRYQVLCANVIGGCDGSTGPGSTDPRSRRPWGLRFPVVTIGDMVNAQACLADRLGIERFHAVAGGCMGGFQALEWMARHPARLARAVVISATPRTTSHNLGLWEVLRRALMQDPAFNGGDYYDGDGPVDGQRLVAMFGMMTWMSRAVMDEKFGLRTIDGRAPAYTLEPEFEIQAFLRRIGDAAGNRFDANSLIYLTKAIDYFDLSRGHQGLAQALSGWRGRTLLISYASDWRYPPAEVDEIRVALEHNGAPVEHRTLDSAFGHGAFMYDADGAGEAMRAFLAG